MNHLGLLIKQDISFQFRQGFYLVYAIISAIYIGIMIFLSDNITNTLLPIIIFADPTSIGFFFIGAILFFEREQRVTEALFVTPVTKTSYILSKCISLTLISLIVTLLITIFIHGISFNWIYMILGVTLTSVLFIFIGMIISYFLINITGYIAVGGLILGPFSAPVIYFLGLSDSKLFYLIPTTGTLKLIGASINGELSLFDTFYSIIYLSVVSVLMFLLLLRIEGGRSENH